MPEGTPSRKCPTCGRQANFSTPPVGPFCSDRCKMIDLGRWLGEEYRISEPLQPVHSGDMEDAPGDTADDR